MGFLADLKQRARRLKAETLALCLAARHPGTPWYARAFILAVAAYALSPIDLIPDFVPVIGYLDELILLPLAIAAAVRMIPPEVLAECRERADTMQAQAGRLGRIAAALVLAVWLALIVVAGLWAWRTFGGRWV